MTSFITWAKGKSSMAHSIAMFGIAAACAITKDADLQKLIVSLFKDHPVIASDIVIAAAIIFRYSKSSKKQPSATEQTSPGAAASNPVAADVAAN